MVGIDPFEHRPGARLPGDEHGAHISLGVLAQALKAIADAFQVPARPVNPSSSTALPATLRSAALGRETIGAASTIMARFTSAIRPASLNSM